MSGNRLTSVNDVMTALGGVGVVASMTGRKYTAAHNWIRNGRFPANTFLILSRALKRRRLIAPPSLWDMAEGNKPNGKTRGARIKARA